MKKLGRLTRKIPMPWWFAAWVVLGLLVLVVWPLKARESSCPDQPISWHVQSYKNTTQDKGQPDGPYYIATKKQKTEAGNKKGGAEDGRKSSGPEWLCEEIKITDIAVVFLTYCLALIAWFQLRNEDRNTRNSTRAFIVAGSLYGVPKDDESFAYQFAIDKRPMGSLFNGPWRLVIFNFGQTAGYLTELTWGVCPRVAFDERVPVSEQIKNNTLSGYIRARQRLQYIFDPTGHTPLQFRHVELNERPVDQVLFGMILYKDVFGDEHYSTFAYHVTADYSDGIGQSISDDHD